MYEEIAQVLGVKFIEVAEAASFYTMFPKAKRGKYLIQVCRNISCALLGSHHLTAVLAGQTEYQAWVKLRRTVCSRLSKLNVSAVATTAPMMQVNAHYYENLTVEKVDRLIEEFRSQK